MSGNSERIERTMESLDHRILPTSNAPLQHSPLHHVHRNVADAPVDPFELLARSSASDRPAVAPTLPWGRNAAFDGAAGAWPVRHNKSSWQIAAVCSAHLGRRQ